MNYTLDDFDYHLPKELIAQTPADKRPDSKLLVFNRATGDITDDHFYNIDKYLPKNTTLVVNNSKVEQCRLLFGSKEIFLLKTFNNTTVEALVKPGRAFKKGSEVKLGAEVSVTVTDIDNEGHRILQFNIPLDDPRISKHRHVPLPPYIKQNDQLKDRYQTVYASPLGSKAAPTAGLHFSEDLLAELKQNHSFAEVTLHVGLGTFAPISDETVKRQQLHEETFEISPAAAQVIEAASHITAVGTTSVRALGSAVNSHRKITKPSGGTDIFIQPGFEFKVVDSLITNFHLPKSSLLMLVAALMGYDDMMRVYQHAISQKYRFFSFGDAMLIT